MMSLAAREHASSVSDTPLRLSSAAFATALVAVALFGTGCSLDDNTFHVEGKGPSPPPPKSAFGYRYPSRPPVLTVPDLQSLTDQYNRRHRIVLLDVWAGWSGRCRSEIADLARLQSELAGEDFQVISCNLDGPDQWTGRTVPMLQAAGANFPCVVIRPENRSALRQWLDPNWSYDLPARFIVDRRGEVAVRMFSSTAIDEVGSHARRLVARAGKPASFAGLSDSAVSLRMKLVNVRTGQYQTLSDVMSDPADSARLASRIVRVLEAQVDRTANPRIAVLPFGSTRDRSRPVALGLETAERIVALLRQDGYYDLVGPARTQRMIRDADLSALGIDFDPALIKGELNVDYLLFGWLSGNVEDASGPPSAIADAGSDANED